LFVPRLAELLVCSAPRWVACLSLAPDVMWLNIGLHLKNNKITRYPRFRFILKTGIAFPKTGVCFYCGYSENETPCYEREANTGLCWYFPREDRPVFSRIIGKLSPSPLKYLSEFGSILKNNQNTRITLVLISHQEGVGASLKRCYVFAEYFLDLGYLLVSEWTVGVHIIAKLYDSYLLLWLLRRGCHRRHQQT